MCSVCDIEVENDPMKYNNATNPAFPVIDPKAPPSDFEWTCGLNKRELFAAMAMQGALADPNRSGTPAEYAEFARMCAGALLAELAK